MHIAIRTAALSTDTPTALQRAADLGYRIVELNMQAAEFGYGYRRKTNARFYRTLRAQLTALHLDVWSATPPDLTQAQMFSEQARKDILLSGAIAAGIVGSRVYAVGHSHVLQGEAVVATYFNEKMAPPVINGYDEAWVQSVNRRTAMAVRNSDDWIGIPLVNQPERIYKLTEDLAIGWAMDLPVALKRSPLPAWLEKLSTRLALVYAYDESDAGRVVPQEEAWTGRVAALRATQVKCLVIGGDVIQDDAALLRSRRFLEGVLAPTS